MANEGIELSHYDKLAPTTLLIGLVPPRKQPVYLEEILGQGGGSFLISKDDDIVVDVAGAQASHRSTTARFDYRDVIRVKADGVLVGAWIVRRKKEVLVGEGELAVEAIEVSGPGLKAWFDDAVVYPESGNIASTKDTTRNFNFASTTAGSTWKQTLEWNPAVQMNRQDTQMTLGQILVADAAAGLAASPDLDFQYDGNSPLNSVYQPGYATYYSSNIPSHPLYAWGVQQSLTGGGSQFFRVLSTNVFGSVPLTITYGGKTYTRVDTEAVFPGVPVFAIKDSITGVWSNSVPVGVVATGFGGRPFVNSRFDTNPNVYPWWSQQLNPDGADTQHVNFSTEVTAINQPPPPEWAFSNPYWKNLPIEWPGNVVHARWIWDRDTRSSAAPAGDVYFRREFTIPFNSAFAGKKMALNISCDDSFIAYFDGQEVLSSLETNSYTKTFSVDISLAAGDHVIAILARNAVVGAAGLLVSFSSYGDATTGAVSQVYLLSDTLWTRNAYPVNPPGWTVGDLLMKLIQEAKDRGVTSMQNITYTFSTTTDSAGVAWPRRDWTFDVGTKYSDVIQRVEEVAADIYVSPLGVLSAWVKRGTDRSVTSAGTDVVAFQPAMDVLEAGNEGILDIQANTLLVISNEGYFEQAVEGTASRTRYGRVEGFLSVSALKREAVVVAGKAITLSNEAKESYTLNVTADRFTPWVEYGVGDTVLAPDKNNKYASSSQRISSISLSEEPDTGALNYAVEIGDIIKTPEEKFTRWLTSMVDGSLDGTIANTNITQVFGS